MKQKFWCNFSSAPVKIFLSYPYAFEIDVRRRQDRLLKLMKNAEN